MFPRRRFKDLLQLGLMSVFGLLALRSQSADLVPGIAVGVAVRDITPKSPTPDISGKLFEGIDAPLYAKAVAFKDGSGGSLVIVSVDAVSLSHEYTQPILRKLAEKYGIAAGHVVLVSNHTHSVPMLPEPPPWDRFLSPDLERLAVQYGEVLQSSLIDVVGDAIAHEEPADLDYAVGRATFAMNRRAFAASGAVLMQPNPDGPVDWDVPILKIRGANGKVRIILFGYACHGTSLGGNSPLSPDYMGYAERELEAVYPAATAIYLPGFGGDQNPYPRGGESSAAAPWPHGDKELDDPGVTYAKRHGLELAGAVAGVLDRPMLALTGAVQINYRELELPLISLPSRKQIQEDMRNPSGVAKTIVERIEPGNTVSAERKAAVRAEVEETIKLRADSYDLLLGTGEPMPSAIRLPIAALRIGRLTMLMMSGEPTVDYALRLKRVLGSEPLWLVGYAYERQAYIPSARLIAEGGYESEIALLVDGWYGRLPPSTEDLIVNAMVKLSQTLPGQ